MLLAALLVLSPCLDNKRNPGAERQGVIQNVHLRTVFNMLSN